MARVRSLPRQPHGPETQSGACLRFEREKCIRKIGCSVSPKFHSADTVARLLALPKDGGSWVDLLNHPDADRLLIPSMKRSAERGDFGSHPDVYGRLWWDKPCVTIKRECAHVGNGRYSHPEQDRQCTVRELALLNGFPRDYVFEGTSLSNKYRHVGDAGASPHQLPVGARGTLDIDRKATRPQGLCLAQHVIEAGRHSSIAERKPAGHCGRRLLGGQFTQCCHEFAEVLNGRSALLDYGRYIESSCQVAVLMQLA